MPKPKRPRSDRDHRVMLIKMGQKQLGLADDAYRDMLFALTGKRSSTEMHDAEHARVLDHLINSGARLKWNRRAHMKIAEEKKPLVGKIRILLLHLGNRSDGYADALAKRMYRVDRFEWCDVRQLIGIVTALSKELARLRAKAAKAA
jgi:phage gp16-like protein